MSLEKWKSEFENKKIAIWGYGREGRSTRKFLKSLSVPCEITIVDSSRENVQKILQEDPEVQAVAQEDCDFSVYDCILKSPGIVLQKGFDTTHLTSQTELFLKWYRHQTIGITGTKGKSTTTTLVYTLLKEKYPIHLIGNIGVPCFEVIEGMEKGDLAAFELSCHQLEYCRYSPHIAVFLNLFEEHLDHYGTFERYGNAKANILRYQTSGDTAILQASLSQYFPLIQGKKVEISTDIQAEGTRLSVPGHTYDADHVRLIGQHNYLNLAVAYYIATLYGIDDSAVRHALSEFHPLAHRLEDLGEHAGIRYVNDSICTIGQACIQALQALQNVDVVLVGGMDRGIHYGELEDYLAHHSRVNVVFMYATGHRIYAELQKKGWMREGFYEVEDLKQAVEKARHLCSPHHIVLLSPAASSYDHFKNFEERGDVFKKLAFEEQ